MCSEDLNETDFERGNLSVHEDAREIQLHLEADVDVCAIDRRRPPQREATVGNLIQTGSLRVGELLELHRVLESTIVHHQSIRSKETLVAVHDGADEWLLDTALLHAGHSHQLDTLGGRGSRSWSLTSELQGETECGGPLRDIPEGRITALNHSERDTIHSHNIECMQLHAIDGDLRTRASCLKLAPSSAHCISSGDDHLRT